MTSNGQFILQPAQFRLDGGAMFGIIPRPMWMKVAPPDDANRILLALRLWLIKKGNHCVLIDTGIGDYHDTKFIERFGIEGRQNSLAESLAKINLTPHDITDLILSHLHFDHAGGLTAKNNEGHYVPALPNARVHLHAQHYAYACQPTPKDGGSFQKQFFGPVIDQLKKTNKIVWHQGIEGTLIKEIGLHFKTSQGHTPYLMHPYNEEYIYLADLVPTSHHVHLPWVMAYDMQPGLTAQEKAQLFSFVVQKKLTIIFEHDPDIWGASLKEPQPGTFNVLEKKINLNKHAFAI